MKLPLMQLLSVMLSPKAAANGLICNLDVINAKGFPYYAGYF
jgi:hypothetical protein